MHIRSAVFPPPARSPSPTHENDLHFTTLGVTPHTQIGDVRLIFFEDGTQHYCCFVVFLLLRSYLYTPCVVSGHTWRRRITCMYVSYIRRTTVCIFICMIRMIRYVHTSNIRCIMSYIRRMIRGTYVRYLFAQGLFGRKQTCGFLPFHDSHAVWYSPVPRFTRLEPSTYTPQTFGGL